MYQLIGKESKKVYVKGKTKSECFKELSERYPTLDYEGRSPRKGRENIPVLPGALLVKKLMT